MSHVVVSQANATSPDALHVDGQAISGIQPAVSPSLPAAWPDPLCPGLGEHARALECWPLLAEIDRVFPATMADPLIDEPRPGEGR